MTSLFDSLVRERRDHTPWASINLRAFISDAIDNTPWDDNTDVRDHAVILTCHYRRDVASRRWWQLEWTGEDGERHSVESQDYNLLLWRAAEMEMQARARREKREKGARS